MSVPDGGSNSSYWMVLGSSQGWNNEPQGAWILPKDQQNYVTGDIQIQQDYASGAKIVATIAANATTGVSSIQVASKNVANNSVLDSAMTAETRQDQTMPGT